MGDIHIFRKPVDGPVNFGMRGSALKDKMRFKWAVKERIKHPDNPNILFEKMCRTAQVQFPTGNASIWSSLESPKKLCTSDISAAPTR